MMSESTTTTQIGGFDGDPLAALNPPPADPAGCCTSSEATASSGCCDTPAAESTAGCC